MVQVVLFLQPLLGIHGSMPRSTFIIAITLCAGTALISGCQSGSKQAAIEVESRNQSQTIRELESKVTEAERLLAQQDRELKALRDNKSNDIVTISATRPHAVADEMLANWGGVSAVEIHRLTSGLSAVGVPPAMHVVLQPVDSDREVIKVAGEITVTASLVDAEGVPQTVGSLELSITDSRKAWNSGLVSSGFSIDLPLKQEVWDAVKNNGRQVVVTASLDLGPSRTYSATEVFGE